MTRKETKQCIAVMQAYADGKQLELFDKYKNEWVDVVDPTWNWYESEYRIKPTLSYRPFHNVEECWKEMQKHRPFGIMSSKNSKDYMSFFIAQRRRLRLLRLRRRKLRGCLRRHPIRRRRTLRSQSGTIK